ncbi:Ca2+-dependent phosphoinositide-specific phospholipase C [Sphingomonas sp. PP-CC-3G-468]|uniref:Ca2+-dependent phosphoinositide-specific phospholipase C n=1 Tax=Sphingomonas sp. PP-CC-3G-468 TaxID=2135656 RepID=UPI0010E1312E|nr:Ca2+-dependent phosphoinositide-specific phospholipase C [Sphingomonas sp. PP-CC-3G-468]TCM04766.1 calcium-dependent phosphoinositide phospholipase C [Sphingomonas sp. PP-CC-3G-468]
MNAGSTRGWRFAVAALLAIAAAGPAASRGSDRVEGLPATLRLDQVQLLGSHNSYKRYPSADEEARIRTLAPQYWDELDYGHPPLEAQFAIGIRQIEIDVAPDPQGGLYATPYQMAAPATRTAMMARGAKVLHFPQVDIESHCLTFRDCLGILRRWSDRHFDHLPVTVLVNASDFPPIAGSWLNDAKFEAADLDALDTDIRAVMGEDRLIIPDGVRGTHATLAEAVRAHAWPTLAAAKGRFVFVLDGNDRHYVLYRAGHPSLHGRAMFGYYDEQSPEAAVFNIQDPRGEEARIGRLVRAGYLVRTRADADTKEARANDPARLDAAIASGAQFVSSDYYDGVPNPHGYGYRASLPGDVLHRCDPAAARCNRVPSQMADR